ncbi:MAG: OmpA family protein [Alphaproteobacteria bacterium]|nr:OmpA family protein [Alphaproteobacteria bacterium]MBL6938022.1 OmpA family protein [Alphaproteobacteria bacterium]MBL7099153.1 OmpA family protein [Alphaproteobacteria bacterium]
MNTMILRLLKLAAPALALALAACAGEPRPMFEPPPPIRESREEAPPPRHLPPPAAHRPSRSPAEHTVAPNGPQGPLLVAKVESYMDALETDLRRHVHGAVIARQGNNINLVITNDKLFSADGGVNGDDILEPLGAVLRGYVHTTVAVSGYTDTAGAPDRNLAVSQKRARSIADALAHEGVQANRISAQGYGETHLRIATGDNRSEPRNRRIEILLKALPG